MMRHWYRWKVDTQIHFLHIPLKPQLRQRCNLWVFKSSSKSKKIKAVVCKDVLEKWQQGFIAGWMTCVQRYTSDIITTCSTLIGLWHDSSIFVAATLLSESLLVTWLQATALDFLLFFSSMWCHRHYVFGDVHCSSNYSNDIITLFMQWWQTSLLRKEVKCFIYGRSFLFLQHRAWYIISWQLGDVWGATGSVV